MKKMILLTVLVAMISTVSFGNKVVAKGQSFSALGDYKIEITDNPVLMKGEDCQAYKISYANSPMEVTVVVCKDRKCKRFVVLSDKLSVQYVCNTQYFGVERLDKSYEQYGYKTSDSALNKAEYFHQKVLGPGHQNEIEAAQLIASNFPFLLVTETSMTAGR
ncbi:MAG: hypothetical protein MUC93_07210 [Bacteroidales bacterium]|jgi:hypothetical protein|nr:hypothetical protein [Bacteroidales bacterium]